MAAFRREARGLHHGFVNAGNRGYKQNGLGITLYAPNINLVRDPRWGRAQEVMLRALFVPLPFSLSLPLIVS